MSHKYFFVFLTVVVISAVVFIKPTREAVLRLYGSFVTVAGIPDELIVPILLNEYSYGDQVTINYGPRGILATNVRATLNGISVASGERVTLTKSGQNEIIFFGIRVSDGQTINATQTFQVIGDSLPTPTPATSSGGIGGSTDNKEEPLDDESKFGIIASVTEDEYNLGDRITVGYKPSRRLGFFSTFDLEARLNNNLMSNNGRPILTKPGRNILVYSGRKTLGGERVNLEHVFHVLASPSYFGLREGDTVAAFGSTDPDIYIVNDHGYKRLFLNPVIFGFYGHLGGFKQVVRVADQTRDDFVTSVFFRNCEVEGEENKRMYALEVTGEDLGTLHLIKLEETKAIQEDRHFLKKIFCINNNEFNWYTNGGKQFGEEYTSLEQISKYERR